MPEPDLKNAKRQKNSLPGIDRIPPHSMEMEQGLLGCIFLSAKETLADCVSALGTDGAQFYDLRHQTIYQIMCELMEDGVPIDVITVQERLKIWQRLDEVGGIAYLSALPDVVPSSANWSYYLDIVREKFLLRKLIFTGTEIVSRVYEFEGNVDQLIDETERDILKVGQERNVQDTPPVRTLVTRAMQRMEDNINRGNRISGIATGFTDFDRQTGGLQNGEMIVIAARPSMGKTSLAMNIAEFIACENKLPVGVFSLEMTADALIERMIYSRARVNIKAAREGFLAERDFPKIAAAAGRISNAPIYIDDRGGLSVMQLRAKARRWVQQYNIKAAVVDYLQLLNALGNKQRRFENRQQEISDVSNGLKSLAKELGIPVIVLSQLNRSIEKEKNRLPRLSDLRESGSIEQDADLVGFLYRPNSGSDDEEEPSQFEDVMAINLLIAKQRNGPTGPVNLTFLRSYTRFESAAKVSDEDVPEAQSQFPT